MNARVGIFFRTPCGKDFYFEKVEFYPYVEYERLKEESETEYETAVAEPGGELFSAARTKYVYYLPKEEYKKAEDIKPVYSAYEDNSEF
jgi:hypothetical protein